MQAGATAAGAARHLPGAGSDAAGGRDLRRKLRAVERRRQLVAFGLVVPLLAFLVATFLVPLAGVLLASFHDPEVAELMPRVSAALRDWDREEVPDEAVFAALVADLAEGYEARTIAKAATRLNYEESGFRSWIMTPARRAESLEPPYRESLVALEPAWGELRAWRLLDSASARFTPRYLLASLDLVHTPEGEIVQAPEDRRIYLDHLWRTFEISLVVTAVTALVGYPLAWVIAQAPPRRARLLLLLVLLPFWTSILVRTAAWVVLLSRGGIVNGALVSMGIVDEPLELIYNRFGVYVAMIHIVLPFMVLPLYSVMKSIPADQLRAAASLGARPFAVFRQVYLPQTRAGLVAGCLLVFVLALGFYITPALVGGRGDQMIAYLIAEFTLRSANWGMASALATILLACVLLLYPVYRRFGGLGAMQVAR